MKQEIKLKNGGKVITTEDGCSFISNNGNKVKLSWSECYNRIMLKTCLKDFCLIGKKEREKVKRWYDKWCQKYKSLNYGQIYFRKNLRKALEIIDYDYIIGITEPIVYKDNRMLSSFEVEEEARQLAPEYNSDMATLYELFMWYAYCIVERDFSLGYLCEKNGKINKKIKNGTKIVRTDRGSNFAICNEIVSMVNFNDVGSPAFDFADLQVVVTIKKEDKRDI